MSGVPLRALRCLRLGGNQLGASNLAALRKAHRRGPNLELDLLLTLADQPADLPTAATEAAAAKAIPSLPPPRPSVSERAAEAELALADAQFDEVADFLHLPCTSPCTSPEFPLHASSPW